MNFGCLSSYVTKKNNMIQMEALDSFVYSSHVNEIGSCLIGLSQKITKRTSNAEKNQEFTINLEEQVVGSIKIIRFTNRTQYFFV